MHNDSILPITNSVLIVSLKSSMDVKSSDGTTLLLKYATSYVSNHAIMKGLLQAQLYLILLLINFVINFQ